MMKHMCGRYSITSPLEAVRALFGFLERPNFPPRYNVAPTQGVPAVRVAADGRHLVELKWGLIPSWAKDPGVGARMINARSETVAEKPAFRAAFRRRRCLLPADGFYEWRTVDGRKQPYRIGVAGWSPFAFAGLWERWEGPDGPVESCSILTTDANEAIRDIHHRMPVILHPSDHESWLDPTRDPETLLGLLRPYPSAETVWHAVDRRVNTVANDDPSLIEPVPDPRSPSPAEPAQRRLL